MQHSRIIGSLPQDLICFIILCCGLLASCGPVALRDKAAPVQALHNLRQIRLALQNYCAEYKTLPPADGPSWRFAVAPFLTGGEKASPEIPGQFSIPLTCSHTRRDETNVFLVSEAQAVLVEAADQTDWDALDRNTGQMPLLIVLHNYCTPWKSEGQIRLQASNNPGKTPIAGELPAVAWDGPATLIRINGETSRYDSVRLLVEEWSTAATQN